MCKDLPVATSTVRLIKYGRTGAKTANRTDRTILITKYLLYGFTNLKTLFNSVKSKTFFFVTSDIRLQKYYERYKLLKLKESCLMQLSFNLYFKKLPFHYFI